MPGSSRLDLALGLPLRNRGALTNLLQQLYDPAHPNYRHFLSVEQFTERFGPTEEEVQKVIAYAEANGLRVSAAHPNRMLIDANGTVSSVEKAFHLSIHVFRHPTEDRAFYAPDDEPTVAADIPLLDISGLDTYSSAHPMKLKAASLDQLEPMTGSGPRGSYMGNDFRAAYVPGTPLTGAGQVVGLLEFDGYYPADITAYEAAAGLPNVPLHNVLIDGFTGVPGASSVEVSVDIEMTVSMAPGLSGLIVYEAPNSGTHYNDLLNRMAVDNQARQISSSWSLRGAGPSATSDQIFQQFAAQGQSFFQASGDKGAYTNLISRPADNPYITVVGGTTLTTASWAGGAWLDETVWNWGGTNGSSAGGISTSYSIPIWQQGVDMSANLGSTTMRNIPDVSIVADNIYVIYGNGKQTAGGGTSVAAPLWAGFAALVNEQAATNGLPRIGSFNPALYKIAAGPNYASDFHDIVSGDNTTPSSLGKFFANPGYDLCTGWGTPSSQLIDDLVFGAAALSITPEAGLTLSGPVGGPFESGESFSISNRGWMSAGWSLINTSVWILPSLTGGRLDPGGSTTTVGVTVNAAANTFEFGAYIATLSFTNLSNHTVQDRSVTLQVVPSGSLQVILMPPEVVTAGAQWRVDDGGWRSSGATVLVAQGSHTVTFSTIGGWQTPDLQVASITPGQKLNLTGQYVRPIGSLQVTLSPAAAVAAGAQWQVDGGAWRDSGETVSGLAAGNHSLAFSPIGGWAVPDPQTVTLDANQTTLASGVYLPFGALRVTLNPAEAMNAGARWQVDGGAWQESGATVWGLAGGAHALAFKAIPSWRAPTNRPVNVDNASLTMATGVYSPTDVTAPSVSILTSNASQWGYQGLTLSGQANDNVRVSRVWYQLNSNAWAVANGTTNWVANVTLGQGSNVIHVYAVDTSGNKSATNSLSAIYAPTARLVLKITGAGTISPNLDAQILQIGKSYTMTAQAGTGFQFTNWLISTNWVGGATSKNNPLQFTMQSNLTVQANFVDVSKPAITITLPAASQRMSNALAAVKGTASDNVRVAAVYYQANTNEWRTALSTNGWTNWMALTELLAGTNQLRAYCIDSSGNRSPTNNVSVFSSNSFKLSLGFGSPHPITNGYLDLSLEISLGLNGRIEVSTNLGQWAPLAGFLGTNSTLHFRDLAAPAPGRRLYRAVTP